MVQIQNLVHIKNSSYKHCVNKSRDMSRDHFAKNRKLLTNWWPVEEKKSGKKIDIINKYLFTFGTTVHCTSIKNYEAKHYFKCPNLILNYLKVQF